MQLYLIAGEAGPKVVFELQEAQNMEARGLRKVGTQGQGEELDVVAVFAEPIARTLIFGRLVDLSLTASRPRVCFSNSAAKITSSAQRDP